MQLRIARKLIRFILLVLAIQFISPVAIHSASDGASSLAYNVALNNHTDKNPSLCILLSENEEKGKEEETRESLCLSELVDFSFVSSALTFSHSGISYHPDASRLTHEPPLNLLCILII